MGVENACSPWATIADVMADSCEGSACLELAQTDPYQLQLAIEDASFMLNAWTAFQYQGGQDGCTATVRPCATYGPARSVPEWVAPPGGVSFGMWPLAYGGTALTVGTGMLATNGFGFCGGGTSPLARRGGCCGGPSQIGLGAYPVNSVSQVLIDGAVVDPAEYRVDDQRWLVRVAQSGSDRPHWPYCQNLALPTTEDHTFAVVLNYGGIVPATGVRAAIALACALAAERCGGPCLIPQNATQVSKEGVTVQLVRPVEDVIDAMPTAVRTFLSVTNPGGLRRRPRVFSPDLPREVVTTTWP